MPRYSKTHLRITPRGRWLLESLYLGLFGGVIAAAAIILILATT